MLQSLGRPEVHMALDVVLVRGSGQEHEGCLLLTSEVLFVVSVSEDTQQQAFPVTEIDCAQDSKQDNLLVVQLRQPRVACDVEVRFRQQGDGVANCRGSGDAGWQPVTRQWSLQPVEWLLEPRRALRGSGVGGPGGGAEGSREAPTQACM